MNKLDYKKIKFTEKQVCLPETFRLNYGITTYPTPC